MELNLDFSGLNSIATRQAQKDFTEPLEEKEVQDYHREEKAPETATEAQEEEIGSPAVIKLQREQEEHRRNLEIYREYQNNIKQSEGLRTDIMRGVKAGEAPQALLLKAVKCISLMTGDNLFYSQIEQDLKTIWGEGFLDRIPLEWELEEVQDRIGKMLEALGREEDPDSRHRLETAISAHRKKAGELAILISKAGEVPTPEKTTAKSA